MSEQAERLKARTMQFALDVSELLKIPPASEPGLIALRQRNGVTAILGRLLGLPNYQIIQLPNSLIPRAVFFDVDFTLIYPGPMFRGEGYRAFCERYGIDVDVARFDQAVASAAPLLDDPEDAAYDAEIFVKYTRHIIEQMGGRGERLDSCAREIYGEWAACRHFELYEDVAPMLQRISAAGVRIGLISNSHRCLTSFQSHFELQGLIAGAISSPDHGFMKPHPSIFQAALRLVDVRASEAIMVGDSVGQDIEGALRAGMRAVLLHRGGGFHPRERELASSGVSIITSLADLPATLANLPNRPIAR